MASPETPRALTLHLAVGDGVLRARLQACLEAAGHNVARGVDGGAEPQLLLSDSRCSAPLAHPTLVLVDAGDTSAAQAAFEHGALDVLLLPLDLEALRQRLPFLLRSAENWLRARRATGLEACQDVAPAGELTGEAAPEVLSGANGRARFLERVARSAALTLPHARHVAVLCIDLRQMRSLSGALSCDGPRRLVEETARRLRDGLRSTDAVARLGRGLGELSIAHIQAEQILVLVPGLGLPGDAQRVAQRVLEILTQPLRLDGCEVTVGAALGIAHVVPGADPEELVRRAGTAAEFARSQAGETMSVWSAQMDARAFERLTLENALRRALENGELRVHYQPRVDVRTGRFVGAEALLRWRHPTLGQVPPLRFIPLAEETGLIVPIGTWALREACLQNSRWQQEGLPPLRMAVNVSAVQFRRPDLFDTVVAALQAAHLEPRLLELELTESLLMEQPEQAVGVLDRLASTGVRLSIDDFGTGYSSLAYLKRFPIHALKIDRSFLHELTSDPDDAAIATSILLMGRSLGLEVVAEGVETRNQLAFLRALQCDEAQGYLFSPAVPAEELAELLRLNTTKLASLAAPIGAPASPAT